MLCDPNDSSNRFKVMVDKQGANCARIGYLESDGCSPSFWEVGYKAGRYSGQISTEWRGSRGSRNNITVVSDKSTWKTTICGMAVQCAGTSMGWPGRTVAEVFVSGSRTICSAYKDIWADLVFCMEDYYAAWCSRVA